MGKLITKYNKMYEDRMSKPVKPKVSMDIFERYKNAMRDKTNLECKFEFADANGNLSLVDENGVMLILFKESFEKDAPYYSERMKDKFLGLTLIVKVQSIDEEAKRVVVVSSVDGGMIKGSLIKEVCIELDKGNSVEAWGDVTQVKPNKILVNIWHRNLLGFIDIKDWQTCFTRYLPSVVKVGDVIKFNITQLAPKKKGKDYGFICDRKPFAPDPWEKLPVIEIGSSMIVQCVDRPKGKSFFWGTSRMVPGIEVMGDYNKNLHIMNTCCYKCKVTDFSAEKHILKVVPFEMINSGIGTEDNVAFVHSKARVHKAEE